MIVCLGWGSLFWDPRNLPTRGNWKEDGPLLPIEFARLSGRHRLTLVFMPGAELVPVLWAELDVPTLKDAVSALAAREEARGRNYIERVIARWPHTDKACSYPGLPEVEEWATERAIDGVVWTALEPKFPKEGHSPSSDEAVAYLKKLEGKPRAAAEQYIRRAPDQIRTAYRRAIEASLGWTPDSAFGDEKIEKMFRPIDRIKYQQLAFESATSFRTAFDCLADYDDEHDLDPTFTPSITCLAFSVELHLKTLKCVLDGEHPKDHKVSALFNSLPAKVQDRIFADMPNWKPPLTQAKYVEYMKQLDDSFIKWRYAPEILERGHMLKFQASFATSLILLLEEILAEHGYRKPAAAPPPQS
jgi:hypothetical protein